MHPWHEWERILGSPGVPHFSHQGGEKNLSCDQHLWHKPSPLNKGAWQPEHAAGNSKSSIFDINFMLLLVFIGVMD